LDAKLNEILELPGYEHECTCPTPYTMPLPMDNFVDGFDCTLDHENNPGELKAGCTFYDLFDTPVLSKCLVLNTDMTSSLYNQEMCFLFYETLSWRRYYYGTAEMTSRLKLPYIRSLPTVDEWLAGTDDFAGVDDSNFWVAYEADFQAFTELQCKLAYREAYINLEVHGAPGLSNFDDALDVVNGIAIDCHDDADLEVNLATNIPLHFRQQVGLCNPSRCTYKDYQKNDFVSAALATIALSSSTASLFFTIAAVVWGIKVTQERKKLHPEPSQDVADQAMNVDIHDNTPLTSEQVSAEPIKSSDPQT